VTAPKVGLITPVRQESAAGFWAGWVRFWFLPRAASSLHSLRFLTALLILLWLLPLAGELDAFFGLSGWLDTQAIAEVAAIPNSPIDARGWSLLYLVGDNPGALQAFFWGTVAVVVLFLLGIASRLTGVLTWLAVCSFSANPLIEGDADVFLRMVTFYLMIGYLFIGQGESGISLISRLPAPFEYFLFRKEDDSGRRSSSAATVALRLIQIHFAIAMVIMGLHKLQMPEWWGGVALWYPLNVPSETTRETLGKWGSQRDYYLSIISIATYLLLAWQIAFPSFAWRRGRWRWLLIIGAIIGCLGSMFLYQIPVFGPVFLVCCLAYLTDDEWQRLTAPLFRLLGRSSGDS
jgi:hypothetical protein